jgi:hypothetical protein
MVVCLQIYINSITNIKSTPCDWFGESDIQNVQEKWTLKKVKQKATGQPD